MFASLLTAFFYALSAVSTRRTLNYINYRYTILLRLALASIFLGLYVVFFGSRFDVHSFWIFFLSGIIGMGLGDVASLKAMPRLGSRLTVLLVQCAAAPIAALTEWIWLGTGLSIREVMCATVILGGVVLAFLPTEDTNTTVDAAGISFALLGAAGQAFGAVLSRFGYRELIARDGLIDGGTAAFYRILGGLAVAIAFFFLRSSGSTHPHDLKKSWPWVIANTMAGPVLGVAFYQWALLTTPVGIVLPIVATAPLLVIPLARLIENDRPAFRSIIGGVISVAGVVGLTIRF